MTHIDLVLVPAGITEKWPFSRFAKKRKASRKSIFSKKKPTKRLIFIWKECTFLCLVVARSWLESRSEYFFWAQKSIFCYRTLDFVALGKKVDLALLVQFFDYLFSSKGRTPEKK